MESFIDRLFVLKKKKFILFHYVILNFIIPQVNNAGTNKGFRPLLQFNDDDIQQVCSLMKLILESTMFAALVCVRVISQESVVFCIIIRYMDFLYLSYRLCLLTWLDPSYALVKQCRL